MRRVLYEIRNGPKQACCYRLIDNKTSFKSRSKVDELVWDDVSTLIEGTIKNGIESYLLENNYIN